VIYHKAFGLKNIENNIPASPDDYYVLFSQTKAITSVAFMTLVDKGLVAVDDPVSKFFPEIPDRVVTKVNEDGTYETRPVASPMTFAHLLSHSSGLNAGLVGQIRRAERKKEDTPAGFGGTMPDKTPSGQHSGGGNDKAKFLEEEMLALVKYPLGFDPGTEWNYHISTNMLAYLIERISGKPLRDYVKETVLLPLGMNHTDWYYQPDALNRFVKPYSAVNGKLEPGSTMYAEGTISAHQTYCEGAIGLNGPIEDYARFCQMLLNKGEFNGKRILKPETVERMTTINQLPEKNSGGKGFQFGLGFELYNEQKKPVPSVSNSAFAWGGMLGTEYIIDPENDLIALFYMNMFKRETLCPLFLENVYKLIANKQVSKPGRYAGYSKPVYSNNYRLSSQYIEMHDGVKLAIDICRPIDTLTGKVVDEPLPVLWMHTPYNRRYNNSKEKMTVDCYAGTASQLVKYGYVVATVDFRGTYASFGHNEGYNRGEWTSAARTDAYDITEWLAAQPWSNGNIGMWGCSATGGSQMQAVTEASPHLKAIFPMSFEFDVYDFRVMGGIIGARGVDRPRNPGDPMPHELRDAMAAPVDTDKDSLLLKQAKVDHRGAIENEGILPYRDSYSTEFTDEASKQWWIKSSPSTYLNKINSSGVAMYMAVNWDEGNTKPGPFFAFNNFTVPRKLIIGPGVHCDWFTSMNLTGFDIVTEELRFFDYWLKGIDNGIMDEDPVYYYTYNAPKGEEWRSSNTWPLAEEQRVKFYLGKASLESKEPETNNSKSMTTVNYDYRSEKKEGILIYETAPLNEDVQVTGHPEMNLWVSSTATDGDFIATLKDVAPDGKIESYNVYGQLRASMRKPAKPPYDYLGLPWHSFLEADALPLKPGEPAQLAFPILPISMIFKAGHKIRLEISFATRGTQKVDPAPEVTVYHDSQYPSCLTLPLIKNY
jgi:putative CocE/NonD family hydrolase